MATILKALRFWVLGGLLAAVHISALAYPERTIRILVVYPPGSSGDVMMRVVGARMATILKQAVVIENRAGGGGLSATAEVAKSPADGYTLLFTGINHITNLALFSKVPYDPIRDFKPIGLIGDVQAVLVANPATGFKSAADLTAAAAAKPGKINFGSAGAGTGGHLAMEMFARANGVTMTHVPYRGASPALIDTIGGQVDVLFTGVPPTLSQIERGKLIPLVVSGSKRSPNLPSVPTMQEIGKLNYDVQIWFGLLAPANVNSATSAILVGAVAQSLKDPEILAKLESLGVIPQDPSPATMERLLARDLERWPKLIRDLGIQAE
jgi:tripartite-type tricarboxylate transporter receptor subunit TctC